MTVFIVNATVHGANGAAREHGLDPRDRSVQIVTDLDADQLLRGRAITPADSVLWGPQEVRWTTRQAVYDSCRLGGAGL